MLSMYVCERGFVLEFDVSMVKHDVEDKNRVLPCFSDFWKITV